MLDAYRCYDHTVGGTFIDKHCDEACNRQPNFNTRAHQHFVLSNLTITVFGRFEPVIQQNIAVNFFATFENLLRQQKNCVSKSVMGQTYEN